MAKATMVVSANMKLAVRRWELGGGIDAVSEALDSLVDETFTIA